MNLTIKYLYFACFLTVNQVFSCFINEKKYNKVIHKGKITPATVIIKPDQDAKKFLENLHKIDSKALQLQYIVRYNLAKPNKKTKIKVIKSNFDSNLQLLANIALSDTHYDHNAQ